MNDLFEEMDREGGRAGWLVGLNAGAPAGNQPDTPLWGPRRRAKGFSHTHTDEQQPSGSSSSSPGLSLFQSVFDAQVERSHTIQARPPFFLSLFFLPRWFGGVL